MPTSASPADRRLLGRTGLSVSPVCIGTSPLASMPALYGYEVAQERAEATILATFRGPFNFMDTSNNYGGGAAEQRIGRALAAARAPELAEPTLAAGETWRDVRDATVDADALGARGLGYEHLDQLALEHLYGVR